MGNFEEKKNFSDIRATHIEIDLSRILISRNPEYFENDLYIIEQRIT